MRKVTRFAPEVGGDATPGVVAFGDGGENRVVEADVPQVRLVGQQVARFPEQGAGRVQHSALDPVIKVPGPGRRIVADELTPVGRGPSGYGVHLQGQDRI